MSRDISEKVQKIVDNNPSIRNQYANCIIQIKILLRMINDELKKENEACDVYTLNVSADHMGFSNGRKH